VTSTTEETVNNKVLVTSQRRVCRYIIRTTSITTLPRRQPALLRNYIIFVTDVTVLPKSVFLSFTFPEGSEGFNDSLPRQH
jgi:hypothetical protein